MVLLAAVIRVAVTVVPETVPATRTGEPTGNWAAVPGLAFVLVEARVPNRVYSVSLGSLGGFDTHADERGTQQRLLTELDGALAPFVRRMAGTAAGRQVVVMVYSEFGRRVVANAGQGTDHGTASPVLLMGASVDGGLHGEQPSLTDLDDGDLRAHVDFRDVYATALSSVLGEDPERILGPGRTPVPGLVATRVPRTRPGQGGRRPSARASMIPPAAGGGL